MRNVLLLVVITCCLSEVHSQKNFRIGQPFLFSGLTNPAALAIEAPVSLGIVHREQWLGIDGSPGSSGLHSSFELNQDMAVGLAITNDRIGVERRTMVQFNYAYKIVLSRSDYISLGVGIGMENMSLNYREVSTSSPLDPVFSTSFSGTQWNASAGIYGKVRDWYFGWSIPEIRVLHPYSFSSGYLPNRWHFYGIMGYQHQWQKRYILEPVVMINAIWNAPVHAELILRGGWKYFAFQGGFSLDNTLLTGVDFTINEVFRTAYQLSFPFGGNQLAQAKGLSHEIMLFLGLPSLEAKEDFSKRKHLNRYNKWKRH